MTKNYRHELDNVKQQTYGLIDQLKSIQYDINNYDREIKKMNFIQVECKNCKLGFDIRISPANNPVFFCSKMCLKQYLRWQESELFALLQGSGKKQKEDKEIKNDLNE